MSSRVQGKKCYVCSLSPQASLTYFQYCCGCFNELRTR